MRRRAQSDHRTPRSSVHVVRDPDRGRRLAFVAALVALVLFAVLWLTIDSNTFSSVHGAP
jgi:hypothetical protein